MKLLKEKCREYASKQGPRQIFLNYNPRKN
jgi:hypothetical protein